MKKNETPTPGMRLRGLMKRADLSVVRLAEIWGLKSRAAANTYVSTNGRGKSRDTIDGDKISALMPHLKGRGHPPITEDEVKALAFDTPYASKAQSPTKTVTLDGALLVRFMLDGALYRKTSVRDFGASSLLPSPAYGPDQWVAIGVEGGRRQMFHCVGPGEFSADAMAQKRVVYAAVTGDPDIFEPMIGTGAMNGRVLGVVIGAYTPE